jgi:hypothetical protein
MERIKIEHLLKLKLSIEQLQLLLSDFHAKYRKEQVEQYRGVSAMAAEELSHIKYAEEMLRGAALSIHRSVNVEA